MSTKFYKKASPKQPVYVGGAPIIFTKVNVELGIYRTDDERIQREFAALQARQVGGIFDITAEEYAELEQKKTTNSPDSYRDEFGKAAGHQRTHRPDNDLVSRAVESEPVQGEDEPDQPVVPAKVSLDMGKKPAARKRA